MTNFLHRQFAIASGPLVAAALIGFLAGTLGVPVVVIESKHKDRSQPYPCMDHACGCRSAEACWRSCCCFTNVQKLAWTAEHGVKPPAYVYAAAAKERPAAVAGCCESHGKSCCESKNSRCEHEAGHSIGEIDSAEEEVEPSPGWSVEFVSAIAARKCQGQANLWLALGAVAPPPAKIELTLEQIDAGRVAGSSLSLIGVGHSPDAPPPRV